jgi:hypothetical protein
LPFGRIVALSWILPCDIGGPLCQAGVGAERSMISVVAVAGFAPPRIITRGRYPSDGFKGNSTDVPYVRDPVKIVFATTVVHVRVVGLKNRDPRPEPA